MKRTALALILIVALLFSAVAGAQFNKAKAETLGPEVLSHSTNKVTILYLQNETYNVNSILVNFTVEMQGTGFDFGYSLDGGTVARVENITKISEHGWIPYVTYIFSGSVFLVSLSEGSHIITIFQGAQVQGINKRYEVFSYDYANFTIDTLAPYILLLSPETRVYNMSDLPLNLIIVEPVSQVTYSLDGQANVTVVGNTMLTNLTYGEHNVTVYATDNVGNIGSETTNFTIAEPTEPFPTTLVIASVVSVAVIGIGLLVYFKKRNHAGIKKHIEIEQPSI